MSRPNPFEPPQAALIDVPPPKSNAGRYVVIALVAIQLLATLRFASTYFELTRTGAAPIWPFLLCIICSSCLYIAALMQLLKRHRGKRMFLVAAVGLGASVPMWGWPYPWSVVAAFGAILGVAGWWVAREGAKGNVLFVPPAG